MEDVGRKEIYVFSLIPHARRFPTSVLNFMLTRTLVFLLISLIHSFRSVSLLVHTCNSIFLLKTASRRRERIAYIHSRLFVTIFHRFSIGGAFRWCGCYCCSWEGRPEYGPASSWNEQVSIRPSLENLILMKQCSAKINISCPLASHLKMENISTVEVLEKVVKC